MNEVSEKKARRKNRGKKARPESDVELGSEVTSEDRGDKTDVWIEKEDGAQENEKKRTKDRKENVNIFSCYYSLFSLREFL